MTFLKRQQFITLYGARVYSIAKFIEKLHQNLTKLETHITFLKKCKETNVIPHGLKMKDTTNIKKNEKLLNETSEKIRNNLLEHYYKKRRLTHIEINTQYNVLYIYLKEIEPNRNHHDDLQWINKHDKRKKDKLVKKHDIKFQTLINESNEINININNNYNDDTPSNVINKSRFNIPNKHLEVLSKGLKFLPTQTSLNTIEIIANTEKSLAYAPINVKRAAVAEISTFILKWKKPKTRNITKEEQKLIKELKQNEEIVIVQADKGGKIVILNKEEYINKIEEKLNDKNTYEQVKDPTNEIKTNISEITNKLFKQNKITLKEKYELTSIDNLPVIRGQPKIHKENNPMRIITCSKNSITSVLSKFIFTIIKDLRRTIDKCITSSNEFIKQISKAELDQNEKLISLDIQDLFSNVPILRSVDIVLNRLNNSETFVQSALSMTDVKKILLCCLNNSYFTFNGKFYKQKKGLPMGNNLSPLLADLFMDEYIKKNMVEVNTSNKLFRYVDDLLIITPMNEDETKAYVKKLNTIKGDIRFTYEYENNKSINFLDVTLTRDTNNKKLNTRWYRKTTASDRLLNYESSHPQSIKNNLVKNMTNRIIETSTNNEHCLEDIEKLKRMLAKSNYPIRKTNKLIEECLKSRKTNENNNNNDDNSTTSNNKKEKTSHKSNKNDEYKHTIILPYVPGIEALKRKMDKLNINIFFTYPNKISSTFSTNTNTESKSIVYQIECSCQSIYNGETKVGLKNRMKQHTKIINNKSNEQRSEIVQHHTNNMNNCKFDPEKGFIIDNEINPRKRKIKETIYSIINESINKHDIIHDGWLHILQHEKTQILRRIETKKQKQHNRFNQTTNRRQDDNSGTDEVK